MPALKLVPSTAPDSPVYEPGKRKRSTGEPPFLSFDEVDRLFSVIHSPRDRAIFRVAYHAGLRASEVGGLLMRDWDPKTERLHVHRLKGSHSGTHHLCKEEARAFRAWLKLRGPFAGAIFWSNRHLPISRRMLDVLMKQYGEAAGVPEKLRHFHVLKHTCATHLLSKGFHVDQVQDWIGHADIRNTMRYAHITNSRRDEMAQELKDSWR